MKRAFTDEQIEKGIHPSEVRHLVELMQVTREIKP